MEHEKLTEDKTSIASGYGLSIECGPPEPYNSSEWKALKYQTTIKHGDTVVWSGEFKLGLGHVKLPSHRKLSDYRRHARFDTKEANMAHMLASKNICLRIQDKDFQDTALNVYTKVAKFLGIEPDIDSVMYSLLSDGSAHFDALTFEDWCDELGFDTDSIRINNLYRECDTTGRRLVYSLGRDKVEELREAYADY